MIFGVREKLFLVSLVLILLVGVTVGTYLENAKVFLVSWAEALERAASAARQPAMAAG